MFLASDQCHTLCPFRIRKGAVKSKVCRCDQCVHIGIKPFDIFVHLTKDAECLVKLRHIRELDLQQKVAICIAGKVQFPTQQTPSLNDTTFLEVSHPLVYRVGKDEGLGLVVKINRAVIEIYASPSFPDGVSTT